MPDFQMCINQKCSARLNCYRFMVKPNETAQSFKDYNPDYPNKCKYFWEDKDVYIIAN